LVYAKGKAIVVNEPSIVAIIRTVARFVAGREGSQDMLGRTPGNVVAIKPMKDGVIADFKVPTDLTILHQKAHNRRVLVHPRIVIGRTQRNHSGENEPSRTRVSRSRPVKFYLVSRRWQPRSRGTPIEEPSGNMVVDIGGGTTEHRRHFHERDRVFAVGGRVAAMRWTSRHALSEAQIHLLVWRADAEQIKMEIGSAYPLEKPLTMEVKGRNLIEGVPRTVTIDDSEIREALSECVATILNALPCRSRTHAPRAFSRYRDRGIVLTGGGALLKNLDKRIP